MVESSSSSGWCDNIGSIFYTQSSLITEDVVAADYFYISYIFMIGDYNGVYATAPFLSV